MNNIGIITGREYFTRVKKKSFILMTLLTPLLITAFYGVIVWVSIGQSRTLENQNIVVVDRSGIFSENLEAPESIIFILQESYSTDQLIASDSVDAIVSVSQDYTMDQSHHLTLETISRFTASNTT